MSLSDLNFDSWTTTLSDQLSGKSIYDLDDDLSALPGTQQLPYRVGAYIDEGSYGEMNRYAQAEIERGAEALLFRLYRQPDTAAIRRILKNIDPTVTELHCSLRYPGQDPAELFRDLITYLRAEGIDLSKVRGSIDFDPLLDWSDAPFPPLVRLLSFVNRWMPGFAVLQVNAAGFNNGTDVADAEIALALSKGAAYLKAIQDHGYSPTIAAQHLKFAVTVGTSFHGDVAKLRTLRALWPKVLAEFGVSDTVATQIGAHTDITTMTGDWEENQELLLQQARSMALGGADVAFLTPLEQVDDTPTVRARNYAIDVHRSQGSDADLQAVETQLATVTSALTEAVWSEYQSLVEQGGFATAVEL
ncbi:methylmalonyl-CoA mutase family protein [Lewinella sp. 4G2]|uniref:methylmalonyl-CoA mutase family protein n=1 Tax=Lewinella sp. 4G2 TaxID=1803372 RepID=UPI0007B461C1|nr:methylmalonyl-CoA mutase family protein [Lewinella sp. 4G2]OAV44140.1 hypothetical protein A3850_006350 [Lewinella sp. 4G2]